MVETLVFSTKNIHSITGNKMIPLMNKNHSIIGKKVSKHNL